MRYPHRHAYRSSAAWFPSHPAPLTQGPTVVAARETDSPRESRQRKERIKDAGGMPSRIPASWNSLHFSLSLFSLSLFPLHRVGFSSRPHISLYLGLLSDFASMAERRERACDPQWRTAFPLPSHSRVVWKFRLMNDIFLAGANYSRGCGGSSRSLALGFSYFSLLCAAERACALLYFVLYAEEREREGDFLSSFSFSLFIMRALERLKELLRRRYILSLVYRR